MPRPSKFGIPGLYEKRGWFYFKPPADLRSALGASPIALGTQDLATAIGKAVELKNEGEVFVATKVGTLEEVLPRYYREKAMDAKKTRRNRERVLNGFRDITGNPRVSRIDDALIQGWLNHLRTKGGAMVRKRRDHKRPAGVGETTVQSYLIILRAFVNWAKEEGMLEGDPLRKFRRLMRVKGTRVEKFLTIEQREKLLEMVEHPDLRLMCHLGLFQGLRPGEMLAMQPSWLWIADDWSQGTLTVKAVDWTSKSGARGRWVPKDKEKRSMDLHPRMLACLKEVGIREPFIVAPHKPWPEPASTAERWDPKRKMRTLGGALGMGPGFGFYTLRHSFATHLALKGKGIRTIAALLGDSIRVTEEHYVGFLPDRENSVGVL